MFIDPPSPFASLEEWEQFLAEMRAIEPKDADVLRHIAEAEAMIAIRLVETDKGDGR